MPALSLFKRSREANKGPSEKQIGKQKAQQGKDQQQPQQDDPSQPEQTKPKYRHVPTHAGTDALLGAPAGWIRDDAERIRENNRRRTAGDAAAASSSAPASLSASAFSTRQNSRKSLMLSPMHADNLHSMPSTPMGGSSSSSSNGIEHEAEGSSRSSSRSSINGDKAAAAADHPGGHRSAHAAKRNTLTNSYSYNNGHSDSSTSLRKSVHWSHSTGHLVRPLSASASVGVGLVGPALTASSSAGSGLRIGANTRSLDAEVNRARKLAGSPAPAMPALRKAGPRQPASTAAPFMVSEQMPPINAETLAFNASGVAAGTVTTAGPSSGHSRRSSSVHSSSRPATATGGARERPSMSSSRPPVSSRLASLSAYLKAPRAAPSAPQSPSATASPAAAATTPTAAGAAGAAGHRSRSRSNGSRRASHGGLGTVL